MRGTYVSKVTLQEVDDYALLVGDELEGAALQTRVWVRDTSAVIQSRSWDTSYIIEKTIQDDSESVEILSPCCAKV